MKDYTYITNPETNQKVSLFSNEGSELLNQYISIFKIGGNGNKIIAYCWTSIPGYSKMGGYRGSGSSDAHIFI